jgi:hypothetical protein
VQAREWDQVDCKLAQVRVQLSWEAQAASDSTHCCTDQVVQVSNCSEGGKTVRTVFKNYNIINCYMISVNNQNYTGSEHYNYKAYQKE